MQRSKPATSKRRSAASADTTEAVDVFMKALRHPAKSVVQALRGAILEVDLSVCEGVKWNAPSFRTHEYFATTNLRAKAGVGVILHFGAKVRKTAAGPKSIADPESLLTWLAKDRAMVDFADKKDFTAKKEAFQAVLRQWITYV
jgi:hypothetical protein